MPRFTRRNHRPPTTVASGAITDVIRGALIGGDPEGGATSPRVVAVGASTTPEWLSRLAGPAGVGGSGGRDTLPSEPAIVAYADAAFPPGGHRSTSDDDALSELLSSAYGSLVPGGLLVLDVGAAPVSGRRRDARTSIGSASRIATALWEAGFVDPRFTKSVDRSNVVLSRRGPAAPPSQRLQVLSVVMPVFNERATFNEVMTALLAKSIEGMTIEIILVESNSTDGTRDEVIAYSDHPRVTVVLEDRPQGKGHAVRAGLARVRGDFVLIQDADLEYSLDDYEVLLDPLRRAEASFVLGRRVSPTGKRGMRHFETQELTSSAMNIGHLVFLTLFNAVYRQRLQDPFTMYKVFRSDCLAGMLLESNRFDFDWELTAKLIRAGYVPVEIPVSYRSRSFTEGKKIRVLQDPLSWVVACVRYRFAPVFGEIPVTYGTGPLDEEPSARLETQA
jgi:hypothetical protein